MMIDNTEQETVEDTFQGFANADEPEDNVPGSFITTEFTFAQGALETFVGLAVAPGCALVDTGAQHGVLGPGSYQHICTVLAEFGLKPRVIETLKMNAVGIGGTTKFQLSAEIPVGIAPTQVEPSRFTW